MSTEKIFLSYSRRQLYFAEALTLHLQQHGLATWFDLQQIEAGGVWSESLKDGVQEAGRLILVVSTAALESEYVQAEWRGALQRGLPLVLAVYEPVELPEELKGLPTYDFRTRFEHTLERLVAYLKGEADAHHDPVPRPGKLGLSFKVPAVLWLTLIALFGAALVPLLGLLVALPFDPSSGAFFWGFVAVSATLAGLFAVPLWRHAIRYGVLKRGLWVSLILQAVAFFVVLVLETDRQAGPILLLSPIVIVILTITVLVAVRRSAALLRWLRPGDDAQGLRRRVHRRLLSPASAGEIAPGDQIGEGRFVLHRDPADRPFAARVRRLFLKAGFVEATASGGAAQHIGVLTNRSSASWVQKITGDFGGRLIYIIGSTIEFKDSLAEMGRYQWVDFREGDARDVNALVHSLKDPESTRQQRALETTPAMIDNWKLPAGIGLLNLVMRILAIYVLVNGLVQASGTLFPQDEDVRVEAELGQALGKSLLAGLLFWMVNRGIVYRKLPALVVYPLFGAVLALTYRLFPVLPADWWITLPLQILVVVLILYSLRDGWYWFPWFARGRDDEIGVKRSILNAIQRRNRWTVVVLAAVVVGILVLIVVTLVDSSG